MCGTLPVVLNYTFCNDEVFDENRIKLLPSITYGALYNSNRIGLGTSDLAAGKCRTVFQYGEVDTCTRKWVNAEMKIEGWRGFIGNYGNYCFLYKHYFQRITTFTSEPTTAPIKTFDTTNPSNTASESPSASSSMMPTSALSHLPSMTPTALKTLPPSTSSTLEFIWRLMPSISCVIDGTNQSCGDYVSTLSSSTPEACHLDVAYRYEVTNIGEICEIIVNATAIIDDEQVISLPVDDWTFCPEDVVILKEIRNENLCDMAGNEVGVKLTLNEVDGSPGESFIAFPDRNSVTSAPTPM